MTKEEVVKYMEERAVSQVVNVSEVTMATLPAICKYCQTSIEEYVLGNGDLPSGGVDIVEDVPELPDGDYQQVFKQCMKSTRDGYIPGRVLCFRSLSSGLIYTGFEMFDG